MIAQIRRVWAGDLRSTVIVIDQDDRREKTCYVWTNTPKGQWIASVCERAERNGHGLSVQRVVLTLKPAERIWGHEIDAAELVPQTVTA